MLLILSSALFLVIGYLYGFYQRRLWDKLKSLEGTFKRDKPEPTAPKSSLVEPPLSPAEQVLRDQEELLERLNPQ